MGREEVASLLEGARSLRDGMVQPDSAPESPARHDLDAARRALGSDLPVRRGIHCAELWIITASDQLFGLSRLLTDGTTVFSLFPLLRSVIEHGAFGAWVIDDLVSSRVRAARAAVMVLRGQEEKVKAAARMGAKTSGAYQDAKATLSTLREQVTREFTDVVVSPVSVDGVTIPRPSDVISGFGERWGDPQQWQGAYDWLCGTANHPSLNGDEFFDVTDPRRPFARISEDLLNRLVRAALVPYLKALEYFVAYMGWDATGIDTYIDRVNRTLGPVLMDGV
jgi:hypothetical protein